MRNIKTREGFEFWDRLNAIPRFSFLLAPSGTRIQKFEDISGNWIDVHEAPKVMDAALSPMPVPRPMGSTPTISTSTVRTSPRALDCSRRRPVTQAVRPASMRESGSILRTPQQALRSAMLSYIARSPFFCTNSITASCTGR